MEWAEPQGTILGRVRIATGPKEKCLHTLIPPDDTSIVLLNKELNTMTKPEVMTNCAR